MSDTSNFENQIENSEETDEFKMTKKERDAEDKLIMQLKKDNNLKDLYVIRIEDKVAYVAPPSRQLISDIMPIIAKQDLLTVGQMILAEGFKGGDSELLDIKSDYSVSACFACCNLIDIKTSNVKKK